MMINKIQVTKADIIVRGSAKNPYFEIKYLLPGDNEEYIGFGSYSLENVFKWKNEYLQIVGEKADED